MTSALIKGDGDNIFASQLCVDRFHDGRSRPRIKNRKKMAPASLWFIQEQNLVVCTFMEAIALIPRAQ